MAHTFRTALIEIPIPAGVNFRIPAGIETCRIPAGFGKAVHPSHYI